MANNSSHTVIILPSPFDLLAGVSASTLCYDPPRSYKVLGTTENVVGIIWVECGIFSLLYCESQVDWNYA